MGSKSSNSSGLSGRARGAFLVRLCSGDVHAIGVGVCQRGASRSCGCGADAPEEAEGVAVRDLVRMRLEKKGFLGAKC